MSYVSDIVFFLLIWWVVFFTTLSVGNRLPEKQETGHAGSAPENHNMGRKALATTGMAVLLWLVLNPLFQNWLGQVRYQAKEMAIHDLEEDLQK